MYKIKTNNEDLINRTEARRGERRNMFKDKIRKTTMNINTLQSTIIYSSIHLLTLQILYILIII